MTSTIITKNSSTASSVPLAASLTAGELAINTADKRLFSKNGSTVFEVGTNPSALTLPNGTANGVPYLNGSKVLTTGSALTFDGANLGLGVTPSAWGGSSAKAFEIGTWSGLSDGGAYGTVLTFNGRYNSGWFYKSTNAATKYEQDGSHRWYTAPSGTAGNAITFTQAMTLDASGNLLVGTTTSSLSNTNSVILGIAGNVISQHISGTASGAYFSTFAYNGTTIGTISQAGTTGVLYNVTSDQRLKENIVDAPEFGSVIDSLQVRSYDWKADGSHQRAGFIAQELVTVAPEAVHQPIDTEEMMAVDYSKLVPMLVKEIQSLRKRLAIAGI